MLRAFEVCVLKVIRGKCDLPNELYVRAQCEFCARQLYCCIGVLYESPPSFMCIRFDCYYAARP